MLDRLHIFYSQLCDSPLLNFGEYDIISKEKKAVSYRHCRIIKRSLSTMKFIYPAVFRKTDKGTYRGFYQNYRYRWNVDSIPPVFLYYDIFRNIATANFYFSFTAFSAVFGVPVSPLPSLPKVQGFRQILQVVYCLRSSDWMLFSHCVIQPSYCRPVFPAPLSLF